MKDSNHKGSGSSAADSQSQDQKLQAMIASVWQRSRHTVAERAVSLRTAIDLLLQGRLDDAGRKNAVDLAHKLAGVLGTFGLARGTDLAREAEVFFGRSDADRAEMERMKGMLEELARLIEIGPNPGT